MGGGNLAKYLVVGVFLVLGNPISTTAGSFSKQSFCERTAEEIKSMPYSHLNRLSFENDGGLFNGGVCWWHNRFERSSNYLAYFAPQYSKPSSKQAKKIIRELMLRKRVVTIPGYENLYEFSKDQQKLIQRQLNLWQVRDALLNQAWILGLSGKHKTTAKKLEAIMDKLYGRYQKEQAQIFVKLQIKGITAHSFLILKITPTSNGYQIETTDSNYSGAADTDEIVTFEYLRGATHFEDVNVRSTVTRPSGPYVFNRTTTLYAPFIPYATFNHLDLKRIRKALENYCGPEFNFSELELSSKI